MASKASASETGSQLYFECVEWLNHEAEILDDNHVREWFDELIDAEIDYRVPIRVTRSRSEGAGFSEDGWHMLDDWGSLEARVMRLETEYAWAEDPPSRARRFVSNVRVSHGETDDTAGMRSNLMIYRGRYDQPDFNLIVGERHDTLVRVEGAWKLRKRLVLLDHATLGTHNLALFL